MGMAIVTDGNLRSTMHAASLRNAQSTLGQPRARSVGRRRRGTFSVTAKPAGDGDGIQGLLEIEHKRGALAAADIEQWLRSECRPILVKIEQGSMKRVSEKRLRFTFV